MMREIVAAVRQAIPGWLLAHCPVLCLRACCWGRYGRLRQRPIYLLGLGFANDTKGRFYN